MNIKLNYNFEKKSIAGVVETTNGVNAKFEIVYDAEVNTLRLNSPEPGEVSYSELPVLRDDINFTFVVVDELIWLISQFCMTLDEVKDPRGQVCWFVIGQHTNKRVVQAFTHAVIDHIKQKSSMDPTYKWDYSTGRLKEVK